MPSMIFSTPINGTAVNGHAKGVGPRSSINGHAPIRYYAGFGSFSASAFQCQNEVGFLVCRPLSSFQQSHGLVPQATAEGNQAEQTVVAMQQAVDQALAAIAAAQQQYGMSDPAAFAQRLGIPAGTPSLGGFPLMNSAAGGYDGVVSEGTHAWTILALDVLANLQPLPTALQQGIQDGSVPYIAQMSPEILAYLQQVTPQVPTLVASYVQGQLPQQPEPELPPIQSQGAASAPPDDGTMTTPGSDGTIPFPSSTSSDDGSGDLFNQFDFDNQGSGSYPGSSYPGYAPSYPSSPGNYTPTTAGGYAPAGYAPAGYAPTGQPATAPGYSSSTGLLLLGGAALLGLMIVAKKKKARREEEQKAAFGRRFGRRFRRR